MPCSTKSKIDSSKVRTGLPLEYLLKELKRVRKLKDREDRQARLEGINESLWKPEYSEVKAELGIVDEKMSISSWVLEGED